MFYRYAQFLFTNTPSSAQVAQAYAGNVNRPLKSSLLTPLRLAYYAYLLLMFTRLTLNSLLPEGAEYSRLDVTVYLFNCLFRHHHHLLGLVVNCFALLGLVVDYVIVVRPHPLVAPMLTDLLQSEGREGKGREEGVKKHIFLKAIYFGRPHRTV